MSSQVTTIEGDTIVIRLTADVAATAFQLGSWNNSDEPPPKVLDKAAFLREVFHEMCREEEDGSTVVLRMIDEAMNTACENGAEGLDFE